MTPTSERVGATPPASALPVLPLRGPGNRWAKAGRLTSIRTIGGHRRFLEDEVRAMLTHERAPYAPLNQVKPQ